MGPIIRRFWAWERAHPQLRLAAWRAFYDTVARLFPDPDLHFMNWGYVPLPGELLAVAASRHPGGTAVVLYAHVLRDRNLSGLDVVEVGCGRGGGARLAAETLGAASVLGVDLSPRNVSLARILHAGVPRLQFRIGEAEQLPLPDASADVVVNVESSHHYSSFSRFVSEVRRILRPGGTFHFADYRTLDELGALRCDLHDSGLEVASEIDITENVIRAMDQDEPYKAELLRERVPHPLRTIMATFMGMQGTEVYESFACSRWRYGSWLLRKPEALT